jgi:type II secretory pathway component GspD/PulD (secretin)
VNTSRASTSTGKTPRLAALAIAWALTSPLLAQNGRPQPQQPASQAPGADDAVRAPTTNSGGPVRARPAPEGQVTLAFNDVPVDEKIAAFIAESTGKVVMPVNMPALKAKKITLMNDEPIDRALALDLLLTALRLNGVGIVETEQLVILDLIDNMGPNSEIPVLGPQDDVLARQDLGTLIVKIFRLTKAPAETVADQLTEKLPTYASLTVDVNSNQIVLIGDVGYAQRVQKMINELDTMSVPIKVETFQLKYADANAVADQIFELFDDSGQSTPRAQRQNQNQQQRGQRQPNQPGGGGAAATAAGVSAPGLQVPLRISVNIQQNSVTVAAEPTKVESIGKLVRQEWDLPLPPENSKVYKLQYTDPLQVRDLLQSLLGAGGSSGGATGGRTGAPRGIQAQQFGQQGGGSVSDVIGDIYRVEAYPDQNAVIVVSKTKESLDYLDAIVENIDQPAISGLPLVVELKHANAFELADELNILLAESGTGQGLQRPGSGLTAEDNLAAVGEDTTGTGGTADQDAGAEQGTIEFPWQSAQPRDDRSDPSSLIGKVRIVPIVRQNALAILSPLSHRESVRQLVESFDKPGRQVMISAIIAEVELNDELALGIRFSSQEIVPAVSDGAIGGSIGMEGESTDVFDGLFDTSVLDANVDLNILIQAMRQKTNVRILQEPRVFTADNQEAVFFDGQDVPFITNTNTSDVSGFQQNIEQQAVGVQLDVRPRITAQRDVDMEINLVLSSIVPGQVVGGNFIVDRRETTTKVIVKNNQTIVLSGILTDTESEITRGIPLLEDIPLFGELFRSRDTTKKTTELIAFITPTVVDNPDANDHNFNESARERLRSLSLPLKEQAKHRESIRDRILAPKGENVPIVPTRETELQRIQREEEEEQRIKEFERQEKELREQMKKEEEESKRAGASPPGPADVPSEDPNAP